MAVNEGNKHAEWITEDVAVELAERAYNMIDDECYFLSDLADKCGTYREQFNYIMKKFNNNERVFNTIKKVFNKCESIVLKKAALKQISEPVGIFILKSYHGLIETSKLNIADADGDKLIPPKIGFE